MSERRDKSNKKFMLLSAIGIFMVVDHHTFTAFNILGDFLPYNSFFMPMFVFISGYFNKVDGSTNLWTYLLKKIKTLLIPYIGLSLTVFGLQQMINWIKLGSEMDVLPEGYLSYVLRRVVTTGSFGAIAEPMWFVIALFSTLMLYAVLKKLLCKLKLWNSYVMLVLFIGLHLVVIHFAKNVPFESYESWLVPLKCLFFFPFLELGVLYREHLEKRHSAMSGSSKIVLLFLLLVVNAIRTSYLPAPYDIAFDSIDVLGGFTSPYIVTPLVSSLIGILFWLTAAELVGKPVYESRFVNFMSCNTFWIMGLHITFYNILNCVLMGIDKSIVKLPGFEAEAFKETEWYFWQTNGNMKILYVMVGVLGPLGLKWAYDKLGALVSEKVKSIGSGAEQKTKVLVALTKPVIAVIFLAVLGTVVAVTSPKANDEAYTPELSGETDDDEYPYDDEEDPYDEPGDDDEDPYDEPGDDDEDPDNGTGEQDPTGQTGDNGQDPTGQTGDNKQEQGGKTGDSGKAKDDNKSIPKDAYPVQAYLDLAYTYGGTDDDYLANPVAVNRNGSYTVTVKRKDDAETMRAFDGLNYMGIRLLDDDQSDLNITKVSITNIKVVCDGVELRVNVSGTAPYEDGLILTFFECYDKEKYGDRKSLSGVETYDFSGKDEIKVTFSIKGAKAK
jgi:Fucose 4-O-acetylase and related acetyltransferases